MAKKPPALPADAKVGEEVSAIADEAKKKAAAVCPGEKLVIFGTVHRCSRLAAKGDARLRAVFAALELSCRNNTDFGRRFVVFCRAASVGPSS